MSKKNKLQNIKAIQQMIDGTHKFQTKTSIGFSDAESAAKKSEKHEIGDIWEEVDPVTGLVTIIEQRDGFRIRKSKNSEALQEIRDYIRSFPNCRKESCTCINPHPLDETMRKANGMCFDCTIEMEHELKKQGKISRLTNQTFQFDGRILKGYYTANYFLKTRSIIENYLPKGLVIFCLEQLGLH
jgi:hypothetical protein